jgi:hypothetical protein
MREVQQILNLLPSLSRLVLWAALFTLLALWVVGVARGLRHGKVGASAHDIFYFSVAIAALTYAKAI